MFNVILEVFKNSVLELASKVFISFENVYKALYRQLRQYAKYICFFK